MKIKLIIIILSVLCIGILFPSCKSTTFDKAKYGNCEDGLANQNEEGVDCGGHCVPCSNCSDGIKNGEETGIDCGGVCSSCSPQCTISPSSAQYTLHPEGFSTHYVSSQTIYGAASYYLSSSEVRIDFSSGTLNRFILQFKSNYNPLDTINIPVNQTMVFKTVDYMTFNISNTSQVKASFNGDIGFSSFNKAVDRDQLVYITRLSKSQALIQMCNLKAGTDTISVNAPAH